MSHIKFHSELSQSTSQEKITASKTEKFSDAVTIILREEAALKMKKLVYVFINVNQITPTSFVYSIDDSRDKISDKARKSIKVSFEEIFAPPSSK